MTQSGNYAEAQGTLWAEECDLQAYWQQLSYPQLLAPGRARNCYRPRRHRIGGLVVAVIGFSRRCGRRP
ncbi:MAG TPA: hypothetical protein VGM12_30690 [Trebonia sp.]|jgi:hypothetical protein